jgi:hypothetical protein
MRDFGDRRHNQWSNYLDRGEADFSVPLVAAGLCGSHCWGTVLKLAHNRP